MLELRILGSLEATADGREVALGGARMRAVLAVLLLRRREVVSVDRIVDEVWGDTPPDAAVKTVQVYVSRLRKSLGESVLLTRGGGYVLDVADEQVDAARFEQLAREGADALAGGDPRRADRLLAEALALWRGPALADLAYEEFAQGAIARLEELRLTAIEDRTEAQLELGRHAQAVPELEALIREHPLRERPRRQLMIALYRCGRHGDALAAYRDAREALVEGLGIEPSRELRELEAQILSQDPRLDGPRRARAAARRERRGARLLLAGGLLLLAALAAAVLARDGNEPSVAVAANSVAVIDPEENRVEAAVPTGVRPADVAADARWIWVANDGDESATQVDPRRRTVVSTTAPGPSIAGLAAGGGSVWVSDNRRSRLLELDPGFRSVVRTVRLVRRPEPLGSGDVNPVAVGHGSVWVGSSYGGIAQVDPKRRAVVDQIAVGNHPVAIATGADAVWVADDVDNTVTRIDPATANAVTATTAVGEAPAALAVGEGAVWVANANDDTVTRLDPSSGGVVQTIRVGRRPAGVAVGSGAVWVANSGAGTVSRIDPRSNTVEATIDVGGAPHGVTVAHGRVWLSVREAFPPPGEPARAGVARVLVPANPAPIDPALDTDQQRLAATCAFLYRVPNDGTAAVVPDAAAGEPAVSADGRTYTFAVRRGFRFAPTGDPVTAAAFARAIERALHPRMGAYGGSLMQDVEGARAFAAGRAKRVRGVTARGQTLVVRLVRRAPDLPARLAASWFCAVPPSTPIAPKGVEEVPMAGPYYVASHVPGRSMVLKRNPYYGGSRPRRLGEIRYRIGISAAQAAAAVEAGRADYVVLHPFFVESSELAPRREAELIARYGPGSAAARAGRQRLFIDPYPGVFYFVFNTRRPVFADVRLRRAVNFAIDRRALAQHTGLGAPGRPTDQLVPAGTPGFAERIIYPLGGPDLAAARRLAGRRRRHAVLYTCNLPDCTRHGQILRSNLRTIGIDLTVRQFPLSRLFERLEAARAGEPFDIAYSNWFADYPDPKTFIESLYGPKGVSPARVDDPELARRMKVAAGLSGARRLRAYADLDRDLSRRAAPAAPFAAGVVTHFLSRRMGCAVVNPIYSLDLASLCVRRGSQRR